MTRHTLLLTVAVLLLAVCALAQDAASLTGTVTFRSGQTLSGIIKSADLGIMDGAGVGSTLSGNGAIKIIVDGQTQRIPAANIATVDAKWVDKSTPEEPRWEIAELKVVTRDGKTLTGKPGWYMHATNVTIQLPSGEAKRVYAFPLAGPDFSPNNLLVRIDLTTGGTAASTPATTTPATTTPATTTPATTTPATTTPATTTPATTTPPTTTTPPATTPAATTPATTTPATTTPVVAAPTAAAVPATVTASGGSPVVVSFKVPGSDKVMSLIIYVTVVDGEVKIVPGASSVNQ